MKWLIKLTQGQFAIVDEQDFCNIVKYKWWVFKSKSPNSHRCYAQGWVDGKQIFMHNLIMGTKEIDHRNHNGLDNRRNNLRKVTRSQNAFNQEKINGTGIFVGITWYPPYQKWRAKAANRTIGYFDDEIQALKARQSYLTKLGEEE